MVPHSYSHVNKKLNKNIRTDKLNYTLEADASFGAAA